MTNGAGGQILGFENTCIGDRDEGEFQRPLCKCPARSVVWPKCDDTSCANGGEQSLNLSGKNGHIDWASKDVGDENLI